jgi:hypothetical protein
MTFKKDLRIMMPRIIVFTVLLLFNSNVIVFGASMFRCGHDIVSIGDTDQEVIRKCGEPTSKQITGEKTTGYSWSTGNWESVDVSRRRNKRTPTTPYVEGYSEVSQKIEAWDYNCGAHRFSVTLIFVGHTLTRIEQKGYGSGESYCNGADRNPNNRKSEIDMREQEVNNAAQRDLIEAQTKVLEEQAADLKYERTVSKAEKRVDKTRDLLNEEEATYESRLLEDAIRGVYIGNIEAIQNYLDITGTESIRIEQFKNKPDGSILVDFGNVNTVTFDSPEDFINKILTPLKYHDYIK